MRQAPPVLAELSEPLVWRALNAVLPALALGVLLFWGGKVLEVSSEAALACAVVAAMAVAALGWRWSGRGRIVLVWDGEAWALDGVPGDLRLMVDLGIGMLLTFIPGGHRGVTWLAMGDAGRPRHALRAAVHAVRRVDRPAIAAGPDREL